MHTRQLDHGLAVLGLILATTLMGCAPPTESTTPVASTHTDAGSITIRGEVTYRERMALPPDSQAHIAIRDAASAVIVAEKTFDTESRQVPIPFELELQTMPGIDYSLQATIRSTQGQTLWTTPEAVPLNTDNASNDLGTLWLVRADTTEPTALALPYKAIGQEPGWLLTLQPDGLMLEWDYGDKHVQTPLPQAEQMGTGYRYAATADGHDLDVKVTRGICHDSMSGIPYPDQVSVTVDGQKLHGCGGEPRSLLAGKTWLVEDINDGGIIDDSHVTLEFSADGQVSGHAGCNHYSGAYKLDGEALSFGPIASTLMACVPALDKQEERFLDVLNNTRSFDIDEHGRLTLRTNSDTSLTATASTKQD